MITESRVRASEPALVELVRRRAAGELDDPAFIAAVEALAVALRTTPVELVARHREGRRYAALWAHGPGVFLPDLDFRPARIPLPRSAPRVMAPPTAVSPRSRLQKPQLALAVCCGLTLLSGVSALALR